MNRHNYRIVVSLGTDHHRFDRLVHWVDHWLGLLEVPPATLVQHGFTDGPKLADGVDRLPRTELLELYSEADLVIVQGGPGSILDARESGRIPIAVPRLPQLHEVVDGHQVAFVRVMEQSGEAFAAGSLEKLIELGDAVLREPDIARTVPRIPDGIKAAERLEKVVGNMELSPGRRIRLKRLGEAWLGR